ncbi:hypothetical protein Gorai_008045 [Gossypium raimondii]|uniref:Zinc knuckle CX2CX4HX4C domain-containing protein n=1 Tax=Gossypium raimondii TaxID=29730 RepID=A0A7J8Q9N6_GOSRA|nr:hypothetical protein [Gossypium raimondii]
MAVDPPSVEKVEKIYYNIDNGMRGNFARIAISVDLRHPLVSKIMIENHIQRVEHEAMSNIFFSCGRYGHLKELGPANRNRAEDGAPMQSSSPEMMKNKQTATENFGRIDQGKIQRF